LVSARRRREERNPVYKPPLCFKHAGQQVASRPSRDIWKEKEREKGREPLSVPHQSITGFFRVEFIGSRGAPWMNVA